MTRHHGRYRGLHHVTVTCGCGWISQNHRSRGEAKRAYDGHVWLASAPRVVLYGVDARRRPMSVDHPGAE
jgi:hypothetical protein